MEPDDLNNLKNTASSKGCLIGGGIGFVATLLYSKELKTAAKGAVVGCVAGKLIEDGLQVLQGEPKAPPQIIYALRESKTLIHDYVK